MVLDVRCPAGHGPGGYGPAGRGPIGRCPVGCGLAGSDVDLDPLDPYYGRLAGSRSA